MRKLSAILSLLLVSSVIAISSPADEPSTTLSVVDFLRVSGENLEISSAPFDALIQHFEKKKKSIKSERDFVRHIFVKTHAQVLKRYRNEAGFQQLFEDGTYNCLTGVILYSLILDHFHIPYNVIETNYHIFMIVQSEQGEILIEATDPINGFVYSEKQIEERIELYKNNSSTGIEVKDYYEYSFNLYKVVSQSELLGLLYYNLAVESYNKQAIEKSIELLTAASELYKSKRINEFARVVTFTVSQSDLDNESKAQLIHALRKVRTNSAPVVAGI